ncbi:MAG: hypothetical protein GY842_11755 [bacterium]|nr:hypothetical protein [bacterium]
MVAVVAPLVAVPLTVVIFHLRSMRDQQAARQDDLGRRLDLLDRAAGHLQRHMIELQRDSTTREEWLRESMSARHRLDNLSAAVTRLETEVEIELGRVNVAETSRDGDRAGIAEGERRTTPANTRPPEQG